MIKISFYKLYILILLIFVFFAVLSFFNIGDRLNINNNTIRLINKKNINLEKLNVTFISSLKEKLIVNGDVSNTKFKDWYGKDYILFEFNGQKEKHKFKAFKFQSWKKVNYELTVDAKNDTILFKWVLKCKGMDISKGIYTAKFYSRYTTLASLVNL